MTAEVIQHLPLDKFLSEPQVRDRLDPVKVDQMAQSFRAVGQLQPIRARRVGDGFDPVDGHYRTAAAKRVGFKTIAAILEEKELSEGEIIQRQLIANCQREDLKPLEIARGIEQLIRLTGWSAVQTANHLGFSESKVSGLRKLLSLPEPILVQVEAGKISPSAASELARMEDPGRQALVAEQIAAGQITRDGISGLRKSAKRPAAKVDGQPSRITVDLRNDCSITFNGPGLTLEKVIGLSEELLAKARRGRSQGFELPTLVKMFRDQARAAVEA